MAEGLSTAASIVAVAACAIESAKLLSRILYKASVISESIHQLLSALISLHATLDALQKYGANQDAKRQLPQRFQQRLTQCQTQLDGWSTRIAKIDEILQDRHEPRKRWKHGSRRSWQKIKWLAVGEQELNRFLEVVKLYHAEFSLELLTLLL